MYANALLDTMETQDHALSVWQTPIQFKERLYALAPSLARYGLLKTPANARLATSIIREIAQSVQPTLLHPRTPPAACATKRTRPGSTTFVNVWRGHTTNQGCVRPAFLEPTPLKADFVPALRPIHSSIPPTTSASARPRRAERAPHAFSATTKRASQTFVSVLLVLRITERPALDVLPTSRS
jgi:hypothetical protein